MKSRHLHCKTALLGLALFSLLASAHAAPPKLPPEYAGLGLEEFMGAAGNTGASNSRRGTRATSSNRQRATSYADTPPDSSDPGRRYGSSSEETYYELPDFNSTGFDTCPPN